VIAHEVATARLRGWAPSSADGEFFRALFADARVTATIFGSPRTPEQSDELLARDIAHWREHRFGPWVFADQASAAPIARGGLKRSVVAGEEVVEILYAVGSRHWGRGYATEIAAAALEAARGDDRIAEVVAFTLTTNHASQRVMQKIGLAFDREVEHAGLPHVLYRAAC
jgi:[ribosomal protein S5]-alanine N-acetyltransferase